MRLGSALLGSLLVLSCGCSSPAGNRLRTGGYTQARAEALSKDEDDLTQGYITDRPAIVAVQNPNLSDGERAEIVSILIGRGAPPDAIDAGGNTVLTWAVRGNNRATVETLLAAGARPDMVNLAGETPMGIAMANGYADIVGLLKSKGASTDVRDNKNQSPYYEAALAGDRAQVDRIYRQGAPVNVKGHSGLEGATLGGHMMLVRHFVEKLGARPANRDAHGQTPATVAGEAGNLEVLKYLVSRGSPVDAGRRTPLMASAAGGHLEVVRWLLDRGASPNSAGGQPSALVYAAVRNQGDVARLLLERGARIPTKLTDDASLRAAGHKTLADELASLGRAEESGSQRLLSAAAYHIAADELDVAAEKYEDKAERERFNRFLMGALVVVGGALQQRQAEVQAKQMAQTQPYSMQAATTSASRAITLPTIRREPWTRSPPAQAPTRRPWAPM